MESAPAQHQHFNSLIQIMKAIPGEQAAIEHFTTIRWKHGAFCPHCGSVKVYHFSDRRTHKCGDCRKRFSIKVGTIFEDSKIGLREWMLAVWLITSHKEGIASTQLARDIGVTQKTAWFVLHRLRYAAQTKSFNRPLNGEIEADETFIGGKEKHKHVTAGSTLMTDEHVSFDGLNRNFINHRVNHSAGKYVRNFRLHTKGIESVWALFKRQMIGTHHWLSPKNLSRYLSEMTCCFNQRETDEGDRVNALLNKVAGRPTYKELIA